MVRRVRGADGRQRWVRAADLRPAAVRSHDSSLLPALVLLTRSRNSRHRGRGSHPHRGRSAVAKRDGIALWRPIFPPES
jgi:hypothetical protein